MVKKCTEDAPNVKHDFIPLISRSIHCAKLLGRSSNMKELLKYSLFTKKLDSFYEVTTIIKMIYLPQLFLFHDLVFRMSCSIEISRFVYEIIEEETIIGLEFH